MHAVTSQARANAASRPRRSRKPPVLGTRVVGHRTAEFDLFEAIYFGDSSCWGELGLACWYRMRTSGRFDRHDSWRVCIDACGKSAYFDAVVDNFGNLVAVSA